MAKNIKTELVIRSIKIIDISYITVLYFIFGYGVGNWLDSWLNWVFGDDMTNKTISELMFEIVIQVMLIGILAYISRNIVELIPYPLNGILGYDHQKVKELKSGALFTVFAIMFSHNFQDKVQKVRNMMIANKKKSTEQKEID